jgi:putative heme iron utilization protein
MSPDHFDPIHAAKILLREARSGAIATLIPSDGRPYCSLVNVATQADGSPLLLISKLAIHTKNLLQDPRISLMLDERKPGDPLEGARIMIMGKVEAAGDAAARRYLARHPDAAAFAGFADFSYYRIVISGAHLVAGFGRIVDLSAAQLLTRTGDAAELIPVEQEACAHMNEDHADTLRLYATRLLGADDGEWRCVGCDPEGLDLQRGREARRLQFPERVTTPGALRRTLRTLADKARQEADARR